MKCDSVVLSAAAGGVVVVDWTMLDTRSLGSVRLSRQVHTNYIPVWLAERHIKGAGSRIYNATLHTTLVAAKAKTKNKERKDDAGR